MGRHAEQRADRDDARAADAGDQDAVGYIGFRQRRFGQRSEPVTSVLAGRLALAKLAAMHGDEARAEALHAGEVLVAGGLVDGSFAAELGLDRDDRQAVRLHPAVAAAFAHGLVDDDALRRIGIELALAPTPL